MPYLTLHFLKKCIRFIGVEEFVGPHQGHKILCFAQINDVMGIVQQYYPNTIKIDYQNSHTKEIENFDIGEIVSDRSFEEIISDFYLKMYGVEISDEELDVMMSAAREAGVIDEAS